VFLGSFLSYFLDSTLPFLSIRNNRLLVAWERDKGFNPGGIRNPQGLTQPIDALPFTPIVLQ